MTIKPPALPRTVSAHRAPARLGVGLLAALLAVAVNAGCAPAAKPRLVIAVQPTANPERLTAGSKEMEAFLEDRLPGYDIEIRVPTLYAGTIEALRFDNAQAAFMSAWPAMLAVRHAGAEVVLGEVREVVIGEEKQERPWYYSYWIVPAGSRYRSLAELRGKRVAFPSPLSTSGYVMPLARLVELGYLTPGDGEADPKQFFGEVIFAGGYAQAWESVKQGQADVTVIAGDVPESLYRQALAASRVLEQQGPIPSHVVVFGKGLAEPARTQLKNALLELGQPAHRDLMRKFISGIFTGFQETTLDEHLGSLDRALQATHAQYTERMR